MNGLIFPKALAAAAKNCTDAAWIGRVVIEVCGGVAKTPLDAAQKMLVGMCRDEMAERASARAAAAERKRETRAKAKARAK